MDWGNMRQSSDKDFVNSLGTSDSFYCVVSNEAAGQHKYFMDLFKLVILHE